MALDERARAYLQVVPSAPDYHAGVLDNQVQHAAFFLGYVDQGLAYEFTLAAQQHPFPQTDHFLLTIAEWFKRKGETLDGFPKEDDIDTVRRVRDMKDLHLTSPYVRPVFIQLSEYTTKRGKRGLAFVAHEVEEGEKEGDENLGKVLLAYRVEEKAPGMWGEYDIEPDPQEKLGFLARIASEIYDYYVLAIPAEPLFGPGGGERVSLRQAA